MSKVCCECGFTKSKSEFSIKRSGKDGLQGYCKECNKKYQKDRHMIKNNPWKLYRVVINLQGLNPKLEFGNPNNLHYNELHYIGITQKPLKDRLNEHISAIRNKKTDGAYFWAYKDLKDVNLDKIELKKYITIELVKEYPSELTKEQMEIYENKEVFEEGKKASDGVIKLLNGELTPVYGVINIEHFPGSKNAKDMLTKYDIIKQGELFLDSKKHS